MNNEIYKCLLSIYKLLKINYGPNYIHKRNNGFQLLFFDNGGLDVYIGDGVRRLIHGGNSINRLIYDNESNFKHSFDDNGINISEFDEIINILNNINKLEDFYLFLIEIVIEET